MAYNIKLKGLEVKRDGKNVMGFDFRAEIKELDELNRTFWAIASTETPDRDKDIIRVEGWNLKNYKKAPRGLWMHNYYEHPHFKTEKIKVDESDALAIALCHAFRMKTPVKKTKDWKSFIEAYPERVIQN